jgi:hypothetical protein
MFTTTLAARRTRLTSLVAAAGAAAVVGLSGLAMAPAPAQAHHYDNLLPALGVCPNDTNIAAARDAQVTAATCLINQVRARRGVAQLAPVGSWYGAGTLYIAAYFKAGDILSCQRPEPSWTWAHTACGRPQDYRVNRYSQPCGGIAENFYHGGGYLGSAREALSWWLHSDAGHREALLSPQRLSHGINMRAGTLQGAWQQVWVHYLRPC